ncbi:MAG: BlaI/MecI/CopY family transcriptional regulator [Methanobacteriota archaeon]
MDLFSWTNYNPNREGFQTVLSPIESEIILIMWREKRATVRTVQTILGNKNNSKRSTINAAMKSLCDRGLLSSSVSKGKGGLKYVYKIKVSRGRFEKEIVEKVLESLLKSYERKAKKLMREKLGRR